jgi:hypothetical protein
MEMGMDTFFGIIVAIFFTIIFWETHSKGYFFNFLTENVIFVEEKDDWHIVKCFYFAYIKMVNEMHGELSEAHYEK